MKYSPGSPAALVAARTAKRPASSASHRKSARTGNVFESVVDELHAECAKAGVALVERVNSHLRIVGRTSDGCLKSKPFRKSCIDCMGRLAGGRAVAVEAKGIGIQIDERRHPLPVAFPIGNVKPHQVDWLNASDADGALTLLLIVHGEPPLATVYAVPWAEVRKSGLRTLGPEFLSPWRVLPGRPYLRRFLPPSDGR